MSANNYPYMNRKLMYKGSVDSGFQEPIDPLVPHDSTTEINNHFAHISRKPDINQSPLGSPILERRHPSANMYSNDQIQQQIASLKQQQEFQQRLLVEQFRQQQQQMAQEHEKQLQEHIKVQQVQEHIKMQQHLVMLQKQQEFLQEQQKLQERHRLEKERMEKERLEQLKNKTKNEESAVASSEVKLRLQEFVLTKKHREAAARNSPPFHNWVEQNSPPQSGLSPPFGPHLLGKYDRDDFPLRKTVDCSSNSDSGPNSPPAGPHALPNGSLASLHSKEDSHSYQMASLYRSVGYHGNDLHLSPSLPNISLGRPPSSSGTNNSSPPHSESELRALEAGRMNMPHPHQSGVPYYPSVPGMEGELPPHHPAYISTQMKLMEESRSQGKLMSHVSPYNNMPPANTASPSTAETHPSRIRHKPLGRTQSAPLPLGHPFLQQQNLLLQQQHSQQVKQQIRQAVLHRAGMENVDEETEAKLQQEMRESREQDADDVIVVKESHMEESSSETLKPQQTFPNHPREAVKHRRHHHHRPLARTQSSPLVTFSNLPQQTQESDPTTIRYRYTTGLAYDSIMQKHQCTCNNNSNHPENEGRLHSIWSRLHETGLTSRCERIKSRKASMEELQSCHSEAHTLLYGTNPLNRQRLDPSLFENMRFFLLPCGGIGVDSDTVWNEMHTYIAARTAVGCVVDLSLKVAAQELKNGFAVVRPPGHHAESHQPMGFCYFNSVAIAAKQLREKMKLERILIVDWDVHHGNSTQQIFYDDPSVLYISIHRHDSGNFFPGTGSIEECGQNKGQGYNVNIAFGGLLTPPMGDAEYLAAFRTIIMPIAREFRPEAVLVSSGFDAAMGHPAPLGGYQVSPACYGHMTRELMSLADGKIVLALEGGYELTAISDAAEMCVKALSGDELPSVQEGELQRPSCAPALETFEEVLKTQAKYWPVVQKYLGTIQYSLMEAQKREMEEADTVSALASLSMVAGKRSSSFEQSEPMEEGES
ncbi:histone deacetylase 4-like isoform X6 [Mytilus trossulus]|uniref:histone deacetylase 4-like isoform X6 n=1 Tax=Mytilus trossulus TaxID=6551 RepID=UPI003007010B